MPEHFNLPWHLAKERGLFEKHGVDVEFIEEPLGTGAMIERVCAYPTAFPEAFAPPRQREQPTPCSSATSSSTATITTTTMRSAKIKSVA